MSLYLTNETPFCLFSFGGYLDYLSQSSDHAARLGDDGNHWRDAEWISLEGVFTYMREYAMSDLEGTRIDDFGRFEKAIKFRMEIVQPVAWRWLLTIGVWVLTGLGGYKYAWRPRQFGHWTEESGCLDRVVLNYTDGILNGSW